MLARPFARMQQHVLDDGIRALAMLDDLFEIAAQRIGQIRDILAGLFIRRNTAENLA